MPRSWASCPARRTATSGSRSRPPGGAGGARSTTARSAASTERRCRFRSKSPERVLDELAQQARRYRSFRFEAVDNILDMAYLKQLFPALAENDAGYEFFYEVKANLSREQLRLLAQAGVTHIQPGIESLSSHVLRPDAQGRPRQPERQPAALGPVLRHRRRLEYPVGFPRRDRAGLRRAGSRHSAPASPAAAVVRRTGSGWSGSARCSASLSVPDSRRSAGTQLSSMSIRARSTSTGSPTSSTTSSMAPCRTAPMRACGTR